jgi:hypothetical protein
VRRSSELRFMAGGFEEAAPPTVQAKLSNAKLVAPLWHGDECVGASGLYAAINGIRLAVAHERMLTSLETHVLMRAGLRFMAGRLTPEQASLSGLRVALWRELVHALVEVTRRRTGIWLRAERLHFVERTREGSFAAIEEAILSWRVPMLLCRGGHYTVISGFTRSSLLLFDSGGARWITKRAAGVPGHCEGARHLLYPGSLLTLNA